MKLAGVSRALVAAATLLAASPSPGQAQFPVFDWLAESFEDLTVFGAVAAFSNRPGALTAGDPRSEAQSWGLRGFGLETSFALGSFWRSDTAGSGSLPRDSVVLDTVQVQIRHLPGQTPETTYTVSRKVLEVERDDDRVTAEIAIGYTELGSFAAVTPGLDVRGAIRELPSVALYLSYEPPGSRFGGYIGGRTGLAQLQSFRAYVGTDEQPDSSFTASGTTFQLGLAFGGSMTVREATLFVEPSWTYRNFESVEWSDIEGFVSERLPRALDFSTWMITLGVQFPLGRGDS